MRSRCRMSMVKGEVEAVPRKAFVQPWTLTVFLRRGELGEELLESACHEGNARSGLGEGDGCLTSGGEAHRGVDTLKGQTTK